MKKVMIGVLIVLALAVAAGARIWTSLPESDCLENCCDNQPCVASATTQAK